ncbi:MAG TPA: pitrilysin family protein [Candidatus Nitrosopolaris sp.]|nr:pitrilysin family protein [Candidatus Nitrosopolaris sp.]
MPRLPLALLALLVIAPQTARAGDAPAAGAGSINLPVVDRTLKNGLLVLVHEDHSAPVVSSYVFYHCGSRNERRGATGIAHLFEHMMFNGGKKFGPGVFDDMIEGNGGSTNGYTSRDLTAYLNNFPREALPVVLDLESDRMAHLAITPQNLEQERGIVKEERRLRIDNEVSGVMDEALYLQAFVQSPRRWNTIGFMSDLDRITLEDARAYFATCYAPNNATLVLAGDVEPAAAFALVERYFGAIPRQKPPPPVDASEPPQDGERRAEVRKNAELPAVLIGYHGLRALDAERPVLDVIERVLDGGESARLHQDLIREHELATAIEADSVWGIDADLMWIYAQARPGKTAAELEHRIDAVMTRLATEPISAEELSTAKNQLRAELVRGLKTVNGKANQLGFFQTVFGDYRAILHLEAEWEAVTIDDVRRVAAKLLVPTQRTVIVLVPVPTGRPAGERPPGMGAVR